MRNTVSLILQHALTLLTALLIVKVTVAVTLNYHNYFPPYFGSDFLRGRESYFFELYQWAFYPHIIFGPLSLFLGLLLISDRFRMRFPRWHRRLGRVQGVSVLLVVAPSGLVMACYAAAGPVAGIGFAALSILTGLCVALGWRAAVRRRFGDHRRWMWRCFLLLCSAVVIRIIGGTATVLEFHAVWFDPVASWVSWLVPLLIFELNDSSNRRTLRTWAESASLLRAR